jgi:hypothetical protein
LFHRVFGLGISAASFDLPLAWLQSSRTCSGAMSSPKTQASPCPSNNRCGRPLLSVIQPDRNTSDMPRIIDENYGSAVIKPILCSLFITYITFFLADYIKHRLRIIRLQHQLASMNTAVRESIK